MIVPDDGMLLEAAGITDILRRANIALPASSRRRPYEWTVVSTTRRRSVQGSSGLRLEADALLSEVDPTRRWDTVLVTGNGGSGRPGNVAPAAEWIRIAARKAGRVASVCAGAFVLAEAGLLRDRKATTHWKAFPEFRARFPEVELDEDSIWVRDGKVFTSAGASAGLDLALAFVEMDLGPEVAREVARSMVLYLRRPGGQSQFSVALERESLSPGPIRDLQGWILDNLEDDLRIDRLAERAAMSPRNFARAFLRETGTQPARYVEDLRVEEARRRLLESAETVERIGLETGLGGALGLRRAFARRHGVTPGEYRERFGRN